MSPPTLPVTDRNRWLSGTKIVDMPSLTKAIASLHSEYRIPHILITSVRFPSSSTAGATPSLSIVGSTRTTTSTPRIFRIEVPALDVFFSGTGDMLAALMLVRLREAVTAVEGLSNRESWISGDEVEAINLPLAKAAEKALASMQGLLAKTKVERDRIVSEIPEDVGEKERHLLVTRAAEVRLVRHLECLRKPEVTYKAEKVNLAES